jgi:succinate-semialdehyde dehydrogenase/glutarate-semialdehyde dehydrogenase
MDHAEDLSEMAGRGDPPGARPVSTQPKQSSIRSVNPATGELLRIFEPHGVQEIDRRLQLAEESFRTYSKTSFSERSRWMTNAAELLEAEGPDLASTMTKEMGKTYASAKAEVAKCAVTMRWFAENAESLLIEEHPNVMGGTARVLYRPIGPVLAVMPWNFPFWQVTRFVAPALMAGNVGLLKHASNVPQCALAFEDIIRRAGFPEGVFQCLLIGSEAVGSVIADPRVRAVTLTGSDAAGMSVASLAGKSLKKTVLELGGSDPYVVMPSCDLARAVSVAVDARVQNNGQSCIAAKRFIIESSIYDQFVEGFVAKMTALHIGDPFDPSTDVGPLATEAVRADADSQVSDAIAKGAQLLCGGSSLEGPGYYYEPTVITAITKDMRVHCEEVFAPVALLYEARDAEDAIKIANSTPYGLGASVWTNDTNEQEVFAEEIEAGMVFFNSMVASTPELPFGGIKRSGYGRELSGHGIKEFCNIKTVKIAH